MPAPTFAIRLPSSVRHTPNSFSFSPLYYHAHDSETEQSPPYRFEVIRDSEDAGESFNMTPFLRSFYITHA